MKKFILMLSAACFFGIIQTSEGEFNPISTTNIEVQMTEKETGELSPEEKTISMFFSKVTEVTTDVINYFSTLLPEKNEIFTEQEWRNLVQDATPVLQNNGELEQDISPLIVSMQKRILYAPNDELENSWINELYFFKNKISDSAQAAMYKLHRLYNLGNVKKTEFKTLYEMIRKFVNRIQNFKAVQATFNKIPGTNVEVQMTEEEINKLSSEQKTELMFLAKVNMVIDNTNKHFLALFSENDEFLTEQAVNKLIEGVSSVLRWIENNIIPLIDFMQKKIQYAVDSKSKEKWSRELSSLRKEISNSLESALNKLEDLYKLNKINKTNFDSLFDRIANFLNRFERALHI